MLRTTHPEITRFARLLPGAQPGMIQSPALTHTAPAMHPAAMRVCMATAHPLTFSLGHQQLLLGPPRKISQSERCPGYFTSVLADFRHTFTHCYITPPLSPSKNTEQTRARRWTQVHCTSVIIWVEARAAVGVVSLPAQIHYRRGKKFRLTLQADSILLIQPAQDCVLKDYVLKW